MGTAVESLGGVEEATDAIWQAPVFAVGLE